MNALYFRTIPQPCGVDSLSPSMALGTLGKHAQQQYVVFIFCRSDRYEAHAAGANSETGGNISMSYQRRNQLLFSLNLSALFVLEKSASRSSAFLWELPFRLNAWLRLPAHSAIGSLAAIILATLGFTAVLFGAITLLSGFNKLERVLEPLIGVTALVAAPICWYLVTHIGSPWLTAERTAGFWLPFEASAALTCGLLTIYKKRLLPHRTGIGVVVCQFLLFCWLFLQAYYFNRPFVLLYPLIGALAYGVWALYMLTASRLGEAPTAEV
jgi:hypothetical protein